MNNITKIEIFPDQLNFDHISIQLFKKEDGKIIENQLFYRREKDGMLAKINAEAYYEDKYEEE